MQQSLRILFSLLPFLSATLLVGQTLYPTPGSPQADNMGQQAKMLQTSSMPTFHKAGTQVQVSAQGPELFPSNHLSSSTPSLSPEVRTQFEGNLDNGFNPSDNTLAISDQGWIVSVVNSSISFYKYDGSIALNSEDLNTFYSYLDFPGYYFNPRVIYDPVAGRFILATLIGKTLETSHLVISFSVSQNPADGWWTYSFDDIKESTNTWMDDLQIEVSDDNLYLTGNLFDDNNVFLESIVLYLDKQVGYQGDNLNYCYLSGFLYGSGQAAWNITPVSNGLGEGGMYLVASKADGGDTIQVISINGSCGGFDLQVQTSLIPVEYYSIGSDGEQLGSTKKLSVGDCRIQDAFYLDNTIYYVQHDQFSNGSNGFRYGKVDVNTQEHIFQRFGLDEHTYAYPSIAPFFDGNGSLETVLIGFCQTAATQYPEFNVLTVRNDFSFSTPVLVKAGETPITASNEAVVPWGEYSGICRRHNAILPTVWVFGTYGKNDSYGNWIAEIVPLGSGPNNPCEQAEQIFCGVSLQGSTSAGNPQILLDCGGSVGTAPGRWYRIVGAGGNITLSTCSAATNFNTKIAVYTGACANLLCVTGADDAGCALHPNNTTLTFYAQDGEEYFIYVTGAGNATGNFDLSVVCTPDQETCTGNQVFTTCTGSLSDGSGSNPYSNNLLCSWTISPIGASFVTLTFTAFDTEENFDSVRVYNGTSSSGNLLGSFTGSTLPNALIANSGSMFVQFETDGSTTRSGWSANYSCSTTQTPIAAFTANPVSGNAPLTVDFTNTSTNATAYAWNFPGGVPATSTATSPQDVVYANPGTYTVTLTVTGPGGTATKTATITVNQVNAPIAAFTASPTSGIAPLTVDFTNTSTNATSYSWSFPGGNPANSMATSPQDVVFTSPGTYTVVLTATGSGGTATQTATITVSGNLPVANFSSSSTCVQVGTAPVNFIDLSQNAPNTWAWQFPGGNPASSNLPSPTVIYTTPGVYDVILTVTNGAGTNTKTQLGFITVVDVKAQTVSGNSIICLGESVLLSATGANTFLWQGPGLSGSGPVVSASPTASGPATYTIVGNTGNCVDAPVTLLIQVNEVPVVSVSVSANEFCLGKSATMTAQGADTYKWTGPGLNTTTGDVVIATPTTPGNYTYTVKGTTNTCISAVQTINILVNTAPSLTVQVPSFPICLGDTVHLTASGASQYSWTGPGLFTNSGAAVSAKPPSSGIASYTVVGTGTNGCTAQKSAQVVVNNIQIVQASANPSTICLGELVTLTATGAMNYQWSGPVLISNTGPIVTALPDVAGISNYQVVGSGDGFCPGPAFNVPVTVLDNPLSVTITVTGCPGPNLVFVANVVNGGAINNITWYLNGVAVWGGPTYTYINAASGSQVYCTVAPQNALPCTYPALATSNTLSCPVSANEAQSFAEIMLLPNPNNGVFQLAMNALEPMDINIRIFNGVGQLTLHQSLEVLAGAQQFPFDLGTKPAGLYWMKVSSGNRTQTIPFIKN